MIEYLTVEEFKELDEIRICWNNEVGKIYPISEKLFNSSFIHNKEILKSNSYVALDENKIVGFILTKTWQELEWIPSYHSIGWISLFFVSSKYRKQGIGSQLLGLVEKQFKELGKEKIILGRETYNFLPGLPVDFINYKKWFVKRGFNVVSEDHDMIRYFTESKSLLPLPNTPYKIRLATLSDKEAIMQFFKRCFKGRWEYEAFKYFQNGGTGREFVIALDEEFVIAFCRINDQYSLESLYNRNWALRFKNLVGVGPLGVDPEYRNKKLGYLVTATAVNEALNRGCSACIIDWTGLVDFYHLFDFEVWKTYLNLEKKII